MIANHQPLRMCSATGEFESRTRLLDLSVGLVEDLDRQRACLEPGPEGFSPDFQVCLPYRGLFVWYVGRDEVVGDANQLLFVRGGEAYRIRGPHAQGYAEVIITPALETLSELAHRPRERLADHPLFRRRSWRTTPHLQRFRARFREWVAGDADADELEAEEVVLELVRSALVQGGRQDTPDGRTVRLVGRAQEFLQAHLANRILLADIARAAGASPAYLTHVFTRVEGLSLHQYLTQLRLARALVELPHAGDLTVLAVRSGFSSHSHFSSAFRRAFGCTPSRFREAARRPKRALLRDGQGVAAMDAYLPGAPRIRRRTQ